MPATDRNLPNFLQSLEWNLTARTTRTAQDAGNGRFYPLGPWQTALFDSHVVVIGIKAPEAPSNYFLGAWAQASIPFLPSSTSGFAANIVTARMMCRLRMLNLFVVPKYIASPWILQLDFPKWHRVVEIEVFEYNGTDETVFDRLPTPP